MVKALLLINSLYLGSLMAVSVGISPPADSTLDWLDYSSLTLGDSLNITLPDPTSSLEIAAVDLMRIEADIICNGILKLSCDEGELSVFGSILAAEVTLEAPKILLHGSSYIDTSNDNGGGNIYLGGGWGGADPDIHNADTLGVLPGAEIYADALVDGAGGTIVLWSKKITIFEGLISSQGMGSGDGGDVEISSELYLVYDGDIDVSAQGSGSSGSVTFDPLTITIQAANPDIDGNNTGLDITSTTELDDATTTPAGFPNANSIITAGALSSLLTNNVTMILAAQNSITVNAAVSPAGTNVTLTLEAPTVNLNSPITLASGGVLAGVGVNTVNVGASGKPQNGVDIAANGATVNLAAATYLGPLNILNKNITLQGAGASSTTLLGPPGGVPVQGGRNPVLFVQNGTNVIISDLTVDANYVGFPTNSNVTGISYLNAGGTIENSHVTKTANTPPPYGGGQQGNGIRVIVNTGNPTTLNIASTTVDFFQKVGILANGLGLTVNITDNQILGYGSPVTPAAIGIQISGSATGSITGNTISGIQFTDHAQSDGILAFSSGPNLIISDNLITGNDEGILGFGADDPFIISDNTISDSGDTGIAILDTSGETQILSNTLTNNGGLAGPSNANTAIYLFSSTSESFLVSENIITPAPGTTAIFTQGSALNLAPDVDLDENIFIDP